VHDDRTVWVRGCGGFWTFPHPNPSEPGLRSSGGGFLRSAEPSTQEYWQHVHHDIGGLSFGHGFQCYRAGDAIDPTRRAECFIDFELHTACGGKRLGHSIRYGQRFDPSSADPSQRYGQCGWTFSYYYFRTGKPDCDGWTDGGIFRHGVGYAAAHLSVEQERSPDQRGDFRNL